MRKTQYRITLEGDSDRTEFKLFLDDEELKLIQLLERMSAKHGVFAEQPILYVEKTVYPITV
jgi:hypothetical protein